MITFRGLRIMAVSFLDAGIPKFEWYKGDEERRGHKRLPAVAIKDGSRQAATSMEPRRA